MRNGDATRQDALQMQIKDIFEVEREGEAKRFEPQKPLGNRRMLWHGSRTSNFGGILHQGMRIAPPEAPKTGYRFGKGAYFADVIGKSASYCRTSGSDEISLITRLMKNLIVLHSEIELSSEEAHDLIKRREMLK